jgi:hypothetical protein
MKIEMNLARLDQIDLSIEAVQRVIDGLPMRIADIAPMMGVKSILEGIKAIADRKEYHQKFHKPSPDIPEIKIKRCKFCSSDYRSVYHAKGEECPRGKGILWPLDILPFPSMGDEEKKIREYFEERNWRA